jgi:hypothetical protein
MKRPIGKGRLLVSASLGLMAVGLVGCLGHTALQRGRLAYNRAVLSTDDQELLLNIVRLRYLDRVKFLSIGGISTQFSLDAGLGFKSNTLVSKPSRLGVQTDASIAERPTISYAPAEGEEFTRRLITPVDLPLVALMSSGGWPLDRILLLAVSHINGVPNSPFTDFAKDGSGPDNRIFREAAEALARLQRLGGVELGWQEVRKPVSPDVAMTAVSPGDVLAAAQKGYEYRKHPGGKGFVLEQRNREPALRLSPAFAATPDARIFRRAFGLSVDRPVYPLRIATQGQTASAREEWKGDVLWASTRSLIEIMYYLSVGTELPREHLARAEAPIIRDRRGNPIDWARFLEGQFRIRSRSDRPRDSSLAVRHRGYWFFIAESDVASRARVADLAEMFNLVVRAGVSAQTPVLTLQVGR